VAKSLGEPPEQLAPDSASPEPRTKESPTALLIAAALLASSFGFAAIEDEPGRVAEAPAPEETVASEASVSVLERLEMLVVAPEADGGDYERRAFKHWVDEDRDGCDSRQEVLIAESRVEPVSSSDKGCPVTEGEWFSLYDGIVLTNPSGLDIDHMVPLKEAWESTASTWTPEQRELYANDLDEPLALIAVTASTNRSKADRDPAQWKPRDETSWCAYATAWIEVKIKWSLTADTGEIAALEEMAVTCEP
jgi:Protein of unknown function (DUF1524)